MVQLGDTGFRFLPVVRKLFLPRHTALQLCQLRQELLERLARLLVFAVRQGIEAHDSPIQTDHRGGLVQRRCNFMLRLNGYEPLAAGLADGDILSFTQHLLRFAIAQPTYLRQFDAPVPVVYREALRDPETLALTFLLELRELRALLKEVAVGALQVL